MAMRFFIAFVLFCTVASTESIKRSKFDGFMARFVNLGTEEMCLWWIIPGQNPSTKEGIRFFGILPPHGGSTAFTTYETNQFFWSPTGKELEVRLQPFVVKADVPIYVYKDETSDPDEIATIIEEIQWKQDYFQKTGRHWLAPYMRPAPVVPYHQPSKTIVKSNAYYATCASDVAACESSRMFRCLSRHNACQKRETIEMTIDMLSEQHPAMYRVSNFLSPFESNHLLFLGGSSGLRKSTVGSDMPRIDPTRQSESAWVAMNRTWVVENIYHRLGDVLNIDPSKMTAEAATNGKGQGVASHLELIHFGQGGHFNRHYDNAPGVDHHLSFITVQLVLHTSNDLQGGHTVFDHAYQTEQDDSFRSIHVKPEELSLVFWYNLLRDGNIDEASMYENGYVNKGELTLCHITIWDPALPTNGDPRMPNNAMYASRDEL